MLNKAFRGSKSLLSTLAYHSRLHQPRERISNHHHCQRHQQQLQHHNHQSLLIPQVFRYLRDFKFSILLNLSNQVLVNPNSKYLKHSNQFRSEEESGQSQNLRTHQRLQQRFRTSRKIIFPSLRIRSTQIIKKLNQKKSCLQGLILQEWYQGDLHGYSADQIKEALTKELKQIGPQGHDAYDPVPLSHLRQEERRAIIESRWVIGPRPGSGLKGRFCAKGFKQVISRDDKYASTPQATTLKLILLMSQIHSWEIEVSDIASAFLNTPVDPSKSPIFVQAPRELPYSEPTVWRLKRQLYGLRDAPKSWQAHFSQIMIKKGMIQMKSDSCTFRKKDQNGHVQLAVTAYVDDLVISGSAQMVKDFITMIQEELTLKHVNFLTSENPGEFLGRTIKRLKNGNITMEFSQKFIDELLKIFEVTGKVTTTGLKLQALPEDQKAQCDKVIHQKFRSAVGKLLWMAQLRNDLKYPVTELSRSLINPQDQDIKFDDQKFHSLAQVCQSDKRLGLRHGASASGQESRGQVSGSDCQLF